MSRKEISGQLGSTRSPVASCKSYIPAGMLVMEFLAEHKEVVEGMVERAVNKRVAAILEEEHEKVLEKMRIEVVKCVWQVIKEEVDGIRIQATEKVCEQWLSKQSAIDGKIMYLHERIEKLEKDQDDADWWKRDRDDDEDDEGEAWY